MVPDTNGDSKFVDLPGTTPIPGQVFDSPVPGNPQILGAVPGNPQILGDLPKINVTPANSTQLNGTVTNNGMAQDNTFRSERSASSQKSQQVTVNSSSMLHKYLRLQKVNSNNDEGNGSKNASFTTDIKNQPSLRPGPVNTVVSNAKGPYGNGNKGFDIANTDINHNGNGEPKSQSFYHFLKNPQNFLFHSVRIQRIYNKFLASMLQETEKKLGLSRPLPGIEDNNIHGTILPNNINDDDKSGATTVTAMPATSSGIPLTEEETKLETTRLLNKISIHDASFWTPLSKVRNRWYYREISGEFSSLSDFENKFENYINYSTETHPYYYQLHILMNEIMMFLPPVLFFVFFIVVLTLLQMGTQRWSNWDENPVLHSLFGAVNLIGFLVPSMIYGPGAALLGLDMGKFLMGKNDTSHSNSTDANGNRTNRTLFTSLFTYTSALRFYIFRLVAPLHLWCYISTGLMHKPFTNEEPKYNSMAAPMRNPIYVGYILSPYLVFARVCFWNEEENRELINSSDTSTEKKIQNNYTNFQLDHPLILSMKNLFHPKTYLWHLKRFRPVFTMIAGDFISRFALFMLPISYISYDLKLLDSKNQLMINFRGLWFLLFKISCSFFLWVAAGIQDLPMKRLHLPAIMAMNQGLLTSLLVSTSPSWESFLWLLVFDWLGFIMRVFAVIPLFESIEINIIGKIKVIKFLRNWLCFYKIAPPLGMSIIRFRMAHVSFENKSLAVGASAILCLLPFAKIMHMFSRDKIEYNTVINENTNIEENVATIVRGEDRFPALLYEFFFPHEERSIMYLMLYSVQQVIQNGVLALLYSKIFGDELVDFTFFTGYWRNGRTRQTIFIWTSYWPLLAAGWSFSARLNQVKELGQFARDDTT